ncbi:hypothetical protein B7Y94_04605 [Candidatus Saccharibacteria bacterium 32-49-12]|nr:MAG: hypothetical protein B7Y94_04605 [Candidatus Saccharibacteria bacterium 32-49-12]
MNRGVPPHPKPWPSDNRLDDELLASGDNRNVADEFRYWKTSAIKQELQRRSFSLEIAIDNRTRDYNAGTIVRTANALGIKRVHIVGRRQWNRRGAMVTDAYMEVVYYDDIVSFVDYSRHKNKSLIAVDNVATSRKLNEVDLPLNSILLFGCEADGVSSELTEKANAVVEIEQFGSTRSINVGVAAGIVMYEWVRRNRLV